MRRSRRRSRSRAAPVRCCARAAAVRARCRSARAFAPPCRAARAAGLRAAPRPRGPRRGRAARGAREAGRDRRRARGSRRPSTRSRAVRRGPRRRPGMRRARASGRSPRAAAATQTVAIASISTSAPDGSAATSTVERAGRSVADVLRVDLVHALEVPRSTRNTVVLTILSRPLPAASRIAAGSRRSARSAPGSSPRSARPRLQAELARDEDEAAGLDRLRVRRTLKRGWGFFRPDDDAPCS